MKTNEAGSNAEVIGQELLIPIDKIDPFKDQPRKHFDQNELDELAQCFKEVGQIVPIIVRAKKIQVNGYVYDLVDGERRLRAAKLAGMKGLKSILEFSTNSDRFEAAIMANWHRVNHTTLEVASAIKYFKEEKKLSTDQICQRFGKKSTQWVDQHLKILKLDPRVLKLLGPETPEDKRLTLQTGLLLTALPRNDQIGIAEMISIGGMTVSQASHLVKNEFAARGIKRKGRQGEEFKSSLNFFRSMNRRIELFMDHADERTMRLFANRKPTEIRQLLSATKDALDNLKCTYETFQKHSGMKVEN